MRNRLSDPILRNRLSESDYEDYNVRHVELGSLAKLGAASSYYPSHAHAIFPKILSHPPPVVMIPNPVTPYDPLLLMIQLQLLVPATQLLVYFNDPPSYHHLLLLAYD